MIRHMTHGIVLNVFSLPFSNLQDPDFYKEVNSNGNPINNDLTLLSKENKSSPFFFDDNCNDDDIDPDSNYIIRQTSNNDRCHYYTEESFNNLLEDKKIKNELTLFHLNVRSIKNKFDDFCTYLHSLKINFSLIGISETWITDNTANLYDISGYKFINVNRKNKVGGGVGMYIKDHIQYKVREDLSTAKEDILETLFIEFKTNNKAGPIVVGVLYRPPDSNLTEFEEFVKELLHKINKEKKECYLMGDLNIDLLKTNQSAAIQNILNQFISSFFYPQITKPTRITCKSATLIDNILANRLNEDDLSGILYTDLSDHLPIFAIKRDTVLKQKLEKVKRRQITPENIALMIEDLSQESWHKIDTFNDPNESYSFFHQKLKHFYDKAFPLKLSTIKENKMKTKPWLTKGLLKSLKTKDKLYKKSIKTPTAENKFKFKQYRNKLNHLLRITKKRYYKTKFEARQTWALINEVINKKKSASILPDAFIHNNEEITDPVEIANKFNEYFTNVGPNLASKIPTVNTSFKAFMSKSRHHESFFIDPVTEEEMEKELLGLNPAKSSGYDSFNLKVIREIAPYIKQPLTSIFNKSFSTGIFPDGLKISLITPVYKNEDKSLFTNYRPVAVLSCFSKILEKIMYKRLIDYIERHNILYDKQYGFRKNHSTEMAIIELTNKLTDAIDEGKLTAGIFLDLSKAFDTVDHSIIISKLEHYGIRGIALQWFRNYLLNRYQIVKFKNSQSEKKMIKCGVPQGSVLGPLLFLLYVNDIFKSSEKLSFILFADDTNIFYQHKDIKVMTETLNYELKKVNLWLQANKLSLNIKKTSIIIFKTRRKRTGNIIVKINDTEIKHVESTKFLGIYIDSNLTWKVHINYIVNKVAKTTGILYKARHFFFLPSTENSILFINLPIS